MQHPYTNHLTTFDGDKYFYATIHQIHFLVAFAIDDTVGLMLFYIFLSQSLDIRLIAISHYSNDQYCIHQAYSHRWFHPPLHNSPYYAASIENKFDYP